MEAVYVSLDEVKRSLEVYATAKNDQLIMDKIAEAARSIDSQCNRTCFAPTIYTVKKDYPNYDYLPAWVIDMGPNTVIELISLTSGGVSIPTGNVKLRRGDDLNEPPYTRLEIDLSSASALSGGSTFQQSSVITILGGWSNVNKAIGTLTSTLNANESATASATWNTAIFGVGDLITIGDERMFIADKTWNLSGATITADLTANNKNTGVAVSDTTKFAKGGWITIDTERMRVIDIVGSNLIVQRGFDGMVLAAHTSGTAVYSYTGVQFERGVLGTTIAQHAADSVIYQWQPPSLLSDWNKAQAISDLMQDSEGWARVVGSGNAARDSVGKGLEDIRERGYKAYARKQRSRGV